MSNGELLEIVYRDNIITINKTGSVFSLTLKRNADIQSYSYSTVTLPLKGGSDIATKIPFSIYSGKLWSFLSAVTKKANATGVLDFSNNSSLRTTKDYRLRIYDIASSGVTQTNIVVGNNTDFFARDWQGAIKATSNAVVYNSYSSNVSTALSGSTIKVDTQKSSLAESTKIENLYSSNDQYVINIGKNSLGVTTIGYIEITDYQGIDTLVFSSAKSINLTSADFLYRPSDANPLDLLIIPKNAAAVDGMITIKNYYLLRPDLANKDFSGASNYNSGVYNYGIEDIRFDTISVQGTAQSLAALASYNSYAKSDQAPNWNSGDPKTSNPPEIPAGYNTRGPMQQMTSLNAGGTDKFTALEAVKHFYDFYEGNPLQDGRAVLSSLHDVDNDITDTLVAKSLLRTGRFQQALAEAHLYAMKNQQPVVLTFSSGFTELSVNYFNSLIDPIILSEDRGTALAEVTPFLKATSGPKAAINAASSVVTDLGRMAIVYGQLPYKLDNVTITITPPVNELSLATYTVTGKLAFDVHEQGDNGYVKVDNYNFESGDRGPLSEAAVAGIRAQGRGTDYNIYAPANETVDFNYSGVLDWNKIIEDTPNEPDPEDPEKPTPREEVRGQIIDLGVQANIFLPGDEPKLNVLGGLFKKKENPYIKKVSAKVLPSTPNMQGATDPKKAPILPAGSTKSDTSAAPASQNLGQPAVPPPVKPTKPKQPAHKYKPPKCGFWCSLSQFIFGGPVYAEIDIPVGAPSGSGSAGIGTVTGSIQSYTYTKADPVILDLQNNGIETIAYDQSNAQFALQADGLLHQTSWVSKNDALLAIDRNQNGVIDDVNELFGWVDQSGFDELKELDTNNDNNIDATDDAFNLLRVWQDANEDGNTDAGELKTLTEAGIRSISLNTTSENFDNNGNHISESVVVTKTDNSTIKAYDAFFTSSNTYTQTAGEYNVKESLLNAPNVSGYGVVQDLLLVASQNAELEALVTSLSSETNSKVIYGKMDLLLSLWADVPFPGDVPEGEYDPGKSLFVEQFLGSNISLSTVDVAVIDDAYLSLKNKIFVDFVAQTSIGSGLGLNYSFLTDSYNIDSSIFYDRIIENLTNIRTSYISSIIAQTLTDADALDLSLVSDSIQRHGYGDFLIGYLNKQNGIITQNPDGSVTGDALNNLMYSDSTIGTLFQGNDGNDVLVSTIGNDTLQGGNGNDVYILDLGSGVDTLSDSTGTDQLVLGAGISKDNLILSQTGNDLVLTVGTAQIATIQNFYTTGTIEKISFIDGASLTSSQILAMTTSLSGTTGNDTLIGNNFTNSITGSSGNDTLSGGAGNDTLNGGSGVDALSGGTGDDFYVVDNAADTVTENAFSGNDTVQSSVSFTLSSNVENLMFTGSSALAGVGNELDNIFTGNIGSDTFTGGLGDDTYIINSLATVIVEDVDAGIDTVQSANSHTLESNVENLTLTGTAGLRGKGNSLNNVITSNTGTDTLTGGLGDDTYIVQSSSTVVTENANEGTDSIQTGISFTLAANVENLTLSGSSVITGTGNSLDNILAGNDAASTLAGSTGNDTYVVQNASTFISENLNEGTDTVQASISYALSSNVENLFLIGTDSIDATGNSLNNMLVGNISENQLDGGTGADTLVGDLGDDTYIVDNSGDVITEYEDEGTDTVLTTISYTLAENVENLTLTGTSALIATGNSLDNILTDNNAASTLAGGVGNDTYMIQYASTSITENNNEGIDTVQTNLSYTLGANVENLILTGSSALSGAGNTLDNILTANNASSSLAGGAGNDTYIIQNVGTSITENLNAGIDTVQSSVSYTLGLNIENLTLTDTNSISATGNTQANLLIGNTADNTLSGSTGADTMIGGLGNDTYFVDNVGDVVTENGDEGVDTVSASISYTLANFVENLTLSGTTGNSGTGTSYDNLLTGNSGANMLRGLAGNDTLDGGTGADTFIGGFGDDTFIVNSTDDVVIEYLNEGNDTVQSSISYTLTANTENLTLSGTAALSGTGNELDNTLSGNTGLDTLIGGLGNDTYILQNAASVITENANEGTDTVQVGSSYTLSTNLENLVLTGSLALTGVGNASNNVLTANSAADTLVGGLGDDTYVITNSATVVTENASEGTDTVQASFSYSLGANIENLILTGTNEITGTGNASNNMLTGNDEDNTLDGGAGADTLAGGLGDDTYIVDDAGDVVNEYTSEGIDTVQSSISYTLSQYLENLSLTGTNTINGTGNGFDNILTGNSAANLLTGLDGNDTLDGGAGIDTLIGGIGDDTYLVDNPADLIVENLSEGKDSVIATTNFTLASNLENLSLSDGEATVGVGNIQDNWLIGNSNNNTLTGLDGNDTLDGGTGADTLVGGAGNDLYIIDNSGDVITELFNGGIDSVQSSVNYTLGNDVENLVLTGLTATSATGNSLANYLVGNTLNNTLTGNSGNDTLNGGAGVDTLIGGIGDDTYVVDNVADVITENANEGFDSVYADISYSLGSNVENLTLTGTQSINATGNALNNILTGNTGDNILTGLGGLDTLIGDLGNDTYIVDNANDIVVENANEGIDTVQANVSYTLVTNVENLILTAGAGGLSGTGNILDNWLTGNESANTLSGLAGNDTLDGGVGTDTLIGGLGDDTYIVDNAGDVITENANEGNDTVLSSISYTLATNVENLTLTGTSALTATGNGLDNILTANSATDTLVGGLGNDTYVLQNATTVVTENASEGTDTVQIGLSYTLGANVENLTLTGYDDVSGTGNTANNLITGNLGNNTLDGASGADTLIGGLGDDTYIVDNAADVVTENTGEGTDTVQSNISYTLGANVENLTLTGSSALTATGNSLNNILTGNSGASTLIGGLGDDTYVLQNATTVITENANEGIDTVQSGLSYTLGANVENLTLTGTSALTATGNSLNNTLTGNSATDTLVGGLGNDTYVLQNATTVVTENASEGTDTVQIGTFYTLGTNVENLTLTGASAIIGTGNSLDNILTGNDAASTLAGGLGNDTYVVQNGGTVITENASEGTDTVQASITYTLSANVENLTLTGLNAINGIGNSLNNVLTGNTAANQLDGGAGADTLIGGLGDDTYIVDNAGDAITENANEGTDTVQASISYTLAANVENLTLTGTSALTATGNSLDNTLTGNSATDTLVGGLGNDTYVLQNATTVVTENASEGTDTVQIGTFYTLGTNVENLILTGSTAITGTGNSLNNTLTGNNAASTLVGGTGNDTYIITNTETKITENLSEGTDTVQSSVNYTLGDDVENLTLTGTDIVNGSGNGLDNLVVGNASINTLVGLDGNDTLDGGAGADFLYGGLGNDLYIVDNLGDLAVELGSSGTDTVQSSVSYTLSANIENLTLTGTSSLNGTGNSGKNTITGNSGANILDGGTDTDTMVGGLGDDTYIVDDSLDVVTENANEGIDTVQTSISYTLGTNVENLTLTGTSALNGKGNSLNNIITGNSGLDTLAGSTGNDTYILQNVATVITENASEGTDTVQVAANYVLGSNLESLILTGTDDYTGTGNSLANSITGNIGNNTLDGSSGIDTLTGGLGNDTYIVDNSSDVIVELSGEGIDSVQASVSYVLSSYIENLTLTGNSNINGTGSADANLIVGNIGNNSLTGGAGNDTLDGGLGGTDTLTGGAGDDLYLVSSTSTVLNENPSEGVDTVQSTVSYTLANYFENLTLTGASNLIGQGTIDDNYLIGNSGNNTLTALGGDDTLDGGIGKDTLIGGLGNDTYLVDNAGDVVTENVGEGSDTIQSTISYALSANVENLTLLGDSAINGTGNTLNNILYGNSSNNILNGGVGSDTMVGGLGDDTYVVDSVTDKVVENNNAGQDTVQSAVDYSLDTNLENLILTGTAAIYGFGTLNDNKITGNSANNILTGYAGNDTIDGAGGIDTLIGGLGDDTYTVDDMADIVTENGAEGIDTVQSNVSYVLGNNVENLTLTGSNSISATGNSLDNILKGNSGDNVLDGAGGNDTYAFSANFGHDTINASSGIDTLDLSQTSQSFNVDLTSTGVSYGGLGQEALLNFAGSDGSSTITDLVGNSWIAFGGDAIGSSNPWLAGQKEVINTSTGYIKNTTLSLNGDNFAIHWRELLTNAGATMHLLKRASSNGFSLEVEALGGKIGMSNSANGSTWFIHDLYGTTTLQNNTWYDIELDYSSTTGYKLFLNGNLEVSSSITTKGIDAGGLILGADWNGAANAPGSIADVYINNFQTLHNSNFTPATTPAVTLGSSISWAANSIENVTSGSGNDTLTGSSGDNVLTGGAGNDTLNGGAGNDTYAFAAGFGTDSISDSNGTDTLDFSAFTTAINVNLGSNSFTSSGNTVSWAGSTIENLTTGSGDDTLTGSTGNNVLNGGKGNDTYTFASGFGTDSINDTLGFNTLDFRSYTTALSINLGTTSFVDGANTVSWSGSTVQGILSGSGGDTLTGNSSDNAFNGGAGSDSLIGGGGNDTYIFATGFGTDTINDSAGTDTLDFSAFTTALNINLSNTSFTQSTGNTVNWTANTLENLITGSGNDTLTGTNLDTLTGSTGNNVLNGGAGNDTLNGGTGDDTYVFAAGFGTDSITDSAGSDTLDFSAFTTAITVNLSSTSFTNSSSTVSWAANALENLTTGSGDDTLVGSTGNNVLNGGLGNDTYVFAASFGTDTITDTDTNGADTLDFSSFTSGLQIDLTTTSFTQSVGNTVSWSGSYIENLTTGSGDDSLIGSSGDNILSAGNGNNTLSGGIGNDTLIGGTGNDTYNFSNGFGVDSLSDAGGTDSINFSAVTSDVSLDLSNSSFSDTLGNSLFWGSTTIENVTTGTGNDVVAGNSSNNILDTGNGNDSITGGSGNDTLNGGAGNDTYTFADGFGSDSINDSSGTDTIDFHALTRDATIDLTSASATSSSNSTSNQMAILNLNGQADGSTTIPDFSGNSWTASGGAVIGSSNPWLTGEKHIIINSAGYFKGAGLSIDSNNYTIRWRERFDNASSTMQLMQGQNAAGSSVNQVEMLNGKIGFSASNPVNGWFIHDSYGKTVLQSNTWYDIEYSYSSTSGYKLFVNGNLEASSTITTKTAAMTGILFGANWDGTRNAQGAIADVYLTNTQTLHDSNFTPASVGYQQVLTNTLNWSGSTIENVVGGSGNDTITGTTGDNILTGGAGNDSLSGGTGNDTYAFADGFGNDTITEAGGTDTLDFSASYNALAIDLSMNSFTQSTVNTVTWTANNIENLTTGFGNDLLTGNSGNNVLKAGSGNNTLNGGAGNDTLIGGIDSDTYVFANGFGADSITDAVGQNILDFSALTNAVTFNATTGSVSSSTDSITWNTTNTTIDKVIGGSGNDNFTGGTAAESFVGGQGNDTLNGGDGNDTYIFANNWGSDSITDTNGVDTVDFSTVTTALSISLSSAGNEVTSSTNTINWSGTIIENVIAGSANDSVNGTTGDNYLTLGAGNDTVWGDAGNDTLDGGLGNDSYVYTTAWGNDSIVDASGTDLIDFSGSSLNVTFNLAAGAGDEVTDGTNTINWTGNIVENVVAGSGNDMITGNSGDNSLSGGSGNDTLDGGTGNDTLDGGAGDDLYNYIASWGSDTINDASGFDTVDLSAVSTNMNIIMTSGSTNEVSDGNNTINWTGTIEKVLTGAGSDTVAGASGGDYISTGAGNDAIKSNAGNDTLVGGTGNDTLTGSTGNDTYLFALGDGSDTVSDVDSTGGNIDTILFDSSIAQNTVAIFKTTSNNLQIGYTTNSTDVILVQSQFVANNSVERFQLSNGQYMTDTDVNTVVTNMTNYATANGISLTSLYDVKNNAGLMSIVAAGWHS